MPNARNLSTLFNSYFCLEVAVVVVLMLSLYTYVMLLACSETAGSGITDIKKHTFSIM
jgi:hypothetical protein